MRSPYAPPLARLEEAPAPAECVVCEITPASPTAADAAPSTHSKKHDGLTSAGVSAASFTARARAAACFAAVVLLSAAYSLLLELSKNDAGRFDFSPLAVTFVAEATKLAISTAAVYGAAVPPPPPRAQDCAAALAPALLYCAQNNAVFLAMRFLTPPLYQLLSNLKIVATALLTRVVLRRALTRHQWLGVALLTLASALPGLAVFAAAGDSSASSARNLLLGTAVMTAVAFSSGLAGVLTERLLKTAPGSTHFKNMQLYSCGCLLYLPALYSSRGSRTATSASPDDGLLAAARDLFIGWTPLTVLLVLNLSFQGLAISWLLRLASNIEKLFAGAAALFASMALSAPLFGYAPRAADVAGGALVCVALVAYHWRELRGGGSATSSAAA